MNSLTPSSTRCASVETETHTAPDFKTALRWACWPFLLSRLWVALFAYWGHWEYTQAGKYLKPFVGGWQGVPNWWLNPWTTYDSERFVHVGERGYDVITSVSFPFYSMLLSPFAPNEVAMSAWGVLLSNLAFLLALAMLFRLTNRDFNSPVARGTLWALAFFPATVIFSAVYAESVFLLLLIMTFWDARGGNWGRAIVWAFLAGLTRNSGPILCVALLVEYAMQRKTANDEDRPTPSLVAGLAIIAPVVAFVGFQLYLRWDLGRGDLVFRQQHALGRTWMWPWLPVWHEIQALLLRGAFNITTVVNLWATLAGIVVAFAYWKRGVLSYTVFLGGLLLAFLGYGLMYAPYTVGAMRYLAVTFPMSQRLSCWALSLAKRPMTRGILIALALMTSAIVAFAFGFKVYLF